MELKRIQGAACAVLRELKTADEGWAHGQILKGINNYWHEFGSDWALLGVLE